MVATLEGTRHGRELAHCGPRPAGPEARTAAWLAVLLTVVLSLLLGKVLVLLALFSGSAALVVTCFWAVRLGREPS